MTDDNGNGYLRYELKMIFEAARLYDARTWVRTHPCAFRTAYPPRQVNNIYFDLPGMSLLADHVDGIEQRYKLRVRWYGEEFSGIYGVIEVKHKDDNVGWKENQPVASTLDLQQMSWMEVMNILAHDSHGWVSEMLQSAQPALINYYQREYFVSGDNQTRLTLDYGLNVFHQQLHLRPNLTFRQPRQNLMLIEIKSGVNNTAELADLLAEFPLRVGRFSKYVGSMDGLLETLL